MIIKVRVIPTTGNNEVISRIGSVLRVKIKNKKVDDDAANEIMKSFWPIFCRKVGKHYYCKRCQRQRKNRRSARQKRRRIAQNYGFYSVGFPF